MFIREIDPALLTFNRQSVSEPKGYERTVRGTGGWDNETLWNGRGMQNSRPVADRFVADPKPKITRGMQREEAVDPFSTDFKQLLAAKGGNLKRISEVMSNGGRRQPEGSLHEGNVIEHQRFGVGKVLRAEGTGENTKATVHFDNVGIKQLLLKFAKFNVIS